MTVYADILFLVNFSLDYVSLYITSRLSSSVTCAWRMTAASAAGAVFAIFALVADMKGGLYILLSAAVCFFMCVITFGRGGFIHDTGTAVMLFATESALGGAISALYSLGRGYSAAEQGDAATEVTIVVATAAVTLVTIASRAVKKRIFVNSSEVTVTNGGKSVVLTAAVDSGSFLSDALSGRPALIVRADSLCGLMPQSVISAAKSCDTNAIAALPPREAARIRILPVHTVNGDGIMISYRPDGVSVTSNGRCRRVDCVVAISTSDGGFGGYDAIMPPSLL